MSFLTREIFLSDKLRVLKSLPGYFKSRDPGIVNVPHFPSINALSQTNSVLHSTVNEILYKLCARTDPFGKLALLFAVTHQSENTLDKFAAAGLSLDGEFKHKNCRGVFSVLQQAWASARWWSSCWKCTETRWRRECTHAQASPGLTALDHAARDGHVDIVRVLAPIHPSPAAPFSHIYYLSKALIQGIENIEITQSLIAAGADVNFVPETCIPPLYHAVYVNDLASVRLLLAAGAAPNGHDRAIPLFWAIYRSNLPMVRALIDAGADIHIRDSERHHVLSCCRNIELLRFFLERGVDPNNAYPDGSTTLHFFCADRDTNDERFVELLCQFGAAPERANGDGKTAVDVAIDCRIPKFVRALEPFVQDPGRKARIAEWLEEQKQQKRLKPSVQADNLA
ncbi:ankyrin repeat-containing domain protein [Mycena olivaceomarginata]|nr:ankyrin repeat-containing domain protein [Mycena olivaceomarginata]